MIYYITKYRYRGNIYYHINVKYIKHTVSKYELINRQMIKLSNGWDCASLEEDGFLSVINSSKKTP